MLYILSLSVSVIAGIMACLLFYLGIKTDDKKRSRAILIFAVLMLGASFGNLEWSFWNLGINMFTFFAFPLYAYFAIWFGFIIWLFESRGERKVWIALLIALAILVLIAVNCMNCVSI
ncbi:MAG: hypothetical protein ABIA21_02775 [Candidatus Aenigmatarchaeota archaeon]